MSSGQHVMITYEGKKISAWVLLESPDRSVLLLSIPCAIDCWRDHLLPVMLHRDGKYRALLSQIELDLEFSADPRQHTVAVLPLDVHGHHQCAVCQRRLESCENADLDIQNGAVSLCERCCDDLYKLLAHANERVIFERGFHGVIEDLRKTKTARSN